MGFEQPLGADKAYSSNLNDSSNVVDHVLRGRKGTEIFDGVCTRDSASDITQLPMLLDLPIKSHPTNAKFCCGAPANATLTPPNGFTLI